MIKKLLVLFCLLATTVTKAQAPQYLNYQGIARDAAGNIITSSIGVKFEVLQGSASGPVVYDETNNIAPSSAGIFTTAIGSGTPGIGTFSSINWATGIYHLRVNIDPAGGTSYSTVGTSQLLSVPYALYAATSGNAATTYSAGNGIAISSGSIINTAPNQTVNISGPAVAGSYPNYTITTPAGLTPSTGISIVGGTVTNTAPDKTVTIVGLGSATVSGTYPNFTISTPIASTSTSTGSLQINPPHSITNLGPNNNSITIQPTNISGPNVIGSYPNYTVGAGAAPVITGTGVTNVITAGNNYTVNTPPVNMLYAPSTGILSYSPAIGSNTVNISPAVSFASGILTIGPNNVTIPGTNVWTRPTATVTTLTNVNDNVGIGTTIPANRLQVVESNAGNPAIGAINNYTVAANANAMGIYASSANSNSVSAGVYGTHSGNGVGVSGINTSATSTTAAGVYGLVVANFPSAIGVEGYGSGAATGMKATSAGNGISLLATKPASAGGGNAGKFEILNVTNTADAILATTNGQGAAVHAATGTSPASALALHIENGHFKSTSASGPFSFSVTVAGGFSTPAFAPTCVGTDVKGVISFSTSVTGFSAINFFDIQYNFQKSYSMAPTVLVTPTTDIKGLSFMILSSAPTNFVLRIFRPNGASFPVTFGNTFFNFNYFIIE